MSVEQLIVGSFNQAFKKYYYDELVIGKLAHSEFKAGVKTGDEVDVIMPATVKMFDYDGKGDLPNAEQVTNSVVKIRLDRGRAFHFELEDMQKKQIEKAPDLRQKVNLVKEYTSDAIKQFAATVDQAYGELYTRAGYYVDNGSGDAIETSKTNVRDLLAYMQATFKRGDGEGHNSWLDGQMIAILPPECQFFLSGMQELEYVESGHRKIEKGYVGTLAGWDILLSNNLKTIKGEDGVLTHFPLFGIKGKTLAGGVSDNLNTKHYMPEKNFNTRYKGYGLYGVGAPRADFFGAAKISTKMTIGQ